MILFGKHFWNTPQLKCNECGTIVPWKPLQTKCWVSFRVHMGTTYHYCPACAPKYIEALQGVQESIAVK